MGKIGTKMPNFGLNRIRPLVRVRSPAPNHANSATIAGQEKNDDFSDVVKDDSGGGAKKSGAISGRKIMIVVDSSVEAKNAVQWALSHTVQNQDMVILLYVTKPSKQGCGRERERPGYSGGRQEARGGAAGGRAEETVRNVVANANVGREPAAAGAGVAEYCVQNASCMAIAVRRKSKKVGGYLITTRRQKDFWLLA
ncbi:hypothetical protein DH2020_012062 [Rehmannia glutinosa]|uniref:UspA domain-containing protein n=1 Tax=Rehmannia glutinosa TaxID=99300 RepID=A0ABR0XF83_REHGL